MPDDSAILLYLHVRFVYSKPDVRERRGLRAGQQLGHQWLLHVCNCHADANAYIDADLCPDRHAVLQQQLRAVPDSSAKLLCFRVRLVHRKPGLHEQRGLSAELRSQHQWLLLLRHGDTNAV